MLLYVMLDLVTPVIELSPKLLKKIYTKQKYNMYFVLYFTHRYNEIFSEKQGRTLNLGGNCECP